MADIIEQIAAWLEPVLKEKDFFLVDVKVLLGKRVEVYIDSDTGVNIDDCVYVSRKLEKQLDGSGLIAEDYVLDVSSPGMTNPLKVPRQYFKRIGRILEVTKTDGTYVEGTLISADDAGIVLQEVLAPQKKKKGNKAEEEAPKVPKVFELPYNQIKKALIQFNF